MPWSALVKRCTVDHAHGHDSCQSTITQSSHAMEPVSSSTISPSPPLAHVKCKSAHLQEPVVKGLDVDGTGARLTEIEALRPQFLETNLLPSNLELAFDLVDGFGVG